MCQQVIIVELFQVLSTFTASCSPGPHMNPFMDLRDFV